MDTGLVSCRLAPTPTPTRGECPFMVLGGADLAERTLVMIVIIRPLPPVPYYRRVGFSRAMDVKTGSMGPRLIRLILLLLLQASNLAEC